MAQKRVLKVCQECGRRVIPWSKLETFWRTGVETGEQRVTKIRSEDAELLALLAKLEGRDRTEILHRALVLYHNTPPAQAPTATTTDQAPGVQDSTPKADTHDEKRSSATGISKRRRRK